MYGLSAAETLLGVAVPGGLRQHVVIVGRVSRVRSQTGHLVTKHPPEHLRSGQDASQLRLGTSYLAAFGTQPGVVCYQELFNPLERGTVPFQGGACQRAEGRAGGAASAGNGAAQRCLPLLSRIQGRPGAQGKSVIPKAGVQRCPARHRYAAVGNRVLYSQGSVRLAEAFSRR